MDNGKWTMDHSLADRPERSVGKNWRMVEQNLAKREREAQSAALLREIADQESAADSAEARSAMEAFVAKHVRPGGRE